MNTLQHCLKTRKAFTLVEIIVVLLIVSVLATLALTNMYSWIEKSKAAEAIVNLGILKDRTELCIVKGVEYSLTGINGCVQPMVGGNGWSYAVNFVQPGYVQINALYDGSNQIQFTRDASGVWKCIEYGVRFSGVC
jgi:prepilin-type N-terminal cleavage/methylation domain-containing protein